jgi:M3 family oligoendopeptidase
LHPSEPAERPAIASKVSPSFGAASALGRIGAFGREAMKPVYFYRMSTTTPSVLPFSDFRYERPDVDAIGRDFRAALDAFRSAVTADDAEARLHELYAVRNRFETMREIASIRYTIDTRDPFYEGEQGFFDREEPRFMGLVHEYYRALLDHPARPELEEKLGHQLFAMAGLVIKTYAPEIVEDLQKENELTTAYRKLKASASIEFEGETRTLTGMMAFMRHKDRDVRRRASEAYWAFLEEQRDTLDTLYDQLVRLRDGMARKLGYANYVQLGYDRLGRTDYGPEQVAAFRRQVLEEVVPLCRKLHAEQAERLGLDGLKHYDKQLFFRSGNPTPQGDPDWIVAQGKAMYEELSPETGEFMNYMLDARLMDLVTKPGKASGGYCSFVHGYKAPFIFSNFNGTAMDIFVLTHEAGHAFQVYRSRDFPFNEYNWPTLEACEIHSMSMEFLTWPWMDRFFDGDADRFRYMHLAKALLFLPYGVAVDEFQHHVYENPTEGPEARAAAWRAIERRYLPDTDYEGHAYLESGRMWQAQGHVYESPFYYIDYTLAQICAFQFWNRSERDRGEALEAYVRLCDAGGSRSFLDLVEYSGLRSPFAAGTVASVLSDIQAWFADADREALETA